MLETARQPKWIAMLVLALVLATVFVVLSAWQFDQTTTDEVPSTDVTETPVPLTDIYEPQRAITPTESDRIVELSGEFVDDTQVMISERIRDGEDGYWAVAALQVDGAPEGESIPVVRGWSSDYQDISDPPGGTLEIQGRLLPTEAPGDVPRNEPAGVLPTLSVAELINLWELDSYSGFVVDLEGATIGESSLEPVWVGSQPETDEVNWLNLFYAVEWVVFAGFAFYLWWRLVKDAHLKRLEEERLDREWEEQWREEQLAKLRAEGAAEPVETATRTEGQQR